MWSLQKFEECLFFFSYVVAFVPYTSLYDTRAGISEHGNPLIRLVHEQAHIFRVRPRRLERFGKLVNMEKFIQF